MGSGNHNVSPPGGCLSTEIYNEYIYEHYQKIDDDDEKINPDWFYLPYCVECKKIGSLQITCVHISSYIKSHYHASNAEMYILNNIIVLNITLHVHVSVM